jgi:hypothetical protein
MADNHSQMPTSTSPTILESTFDKLLKVTGRDTARAIEVVPYLPGLCVLSQQPIQLCGSGGECLPMVVDLLQYGTQCCGTCGAGRFTFGKEAHGHAPFLPS